MQSIKKILTPHRPRKFHGQPQTAENKDFQPETNFKENRLKLGFMPL
jgi:hypothetical protein